MKATLSLQEVGKLLSVIDTQKAVGRRDLAIMGLLLVNGLRSIEVSRVNLEDIREIEGYTVLKVRGKGGKIMDAKLRQDVHDAILSYLANRGCANPLSEQVFGAGSSISRLNIPEFGLQYVLDSNGTKRRFSVLAEGYPLIFYPRHSQGGPIKPFDPVMTQLFLAACAMRSKYSALENRVHTLDEMRDMFTTDDPLEPLLDDKMLLRRWCELCHLNPDSYLHQIKYE